MQVDQVILLNFSAVQRTHFPYRFLRIQIVWLLFLENRKTKQLLPYCYILKKQIYFYKPNNISIILLEIMCDTFNLQRFVPSIGVQNFPLLDGSSGLLKRLRQTCFCRRSNSLRQGNNQPPCIHTNVPIASRAIESISVFLNGFEPDRRIYRYYQCAAIKTV